VDQGEALKDIGWQAVVSRSRVLLGLTRNQFVRLVNMSLVLLVWLSQVETLMTTSWLAVGCGCRVVLTLTRNLFVKLVHLVEFKVGVIVSAWLTRGRS
jgi:hypothetical protein